MVHEKVFHVNQKKVDAAQKSVSCRQKQDHAASKIYFVCKKVFPGTARHILFLGKECRIENMFKICKKSTKSHVDSCYYAVLLGRIVH